MFQVFQIREDVFFGKTNNYFHYFSELFFA